MKNMLHQSLLDIKEKTQTAIAGLESLMSQQHLKSQQDLIVEIIKLLHEIQKTIENKPTGQDLIRFHKQIESFIKNPTVLGTFFFLNPLKDSIENTLKIASVIFGNQQEKSSHNPTGLSEKLTGMLKQKQAAENSNFGGYANQFKSSNSSKETLEDHVVDPEKEKDDQPSITP